jgi:hypothetical protein
MNDLVDLVDQQLRGEGSLKQGRRKVKVSAPKGFARKSINALDDDGLAIVMHRLEARGHSQESVEAFFDRRAKNSEGAKERKSAIAASDVWEAEPVESSEVIEDEDDDPVETEIVEGIVKSILENLKLPDTVVNVQMPSGKQIIHRNPNTKLIEAVETQYNESAENVNGSEA